MSQNKPTHLYCTVHHDKRSSYLEDPVLVAIEGSQFINLYFPTWRIGQQIECVQHGRGD